MGAHRRVKWVGVVDDGVGRVELVAVLTVDELLGQRLEAGRVRQPEHIDQPCLDERPLDPRVPPDLGVVVADHVHHPVALGPREAPQRSEQPLILGAGDRRGQPIPVAVGIVHAQHVEEVPGQHQLNGSLVAVEVLEQQGELAADSKMSLPAAPPMWVSDKNTRSVSSGSWLRMTPSAALSLITRDLQHLPCSQSWSRSKIIPGGMSSLPIRGARFPVAGIQGFPRSRTGAVVAPCNQKEARQHEDP